MTKELLNAKGIFCLAVIEVATGKTIELFEENNLVVTLGHTNIARLLGGDTAGKAITQIAVGTNGTAPTLADNGLTGMFSKAVIGATYPEANSIRFSWAIEDTEANGMTIKEFGLLNVNGVLCARKVRTDIVKTSAVRLVGTWKITINS